MPIYDQSFRRYDGPRSVKALWWPVALYTVRPILKMKFMYFLLLLLVIAVVIISVGFFTAAKMAELAPGQSDRAAQTARLQGMPVFDGKISLSTVLYTFIQPLFGILWLLVLTTGGGSISSDLKNAALPLYFSRPLKPWHYAWGKILGLAIIPMCALSAALLIVSVQYVAYFKGSSGLLAALPSFMTALFYVLLICFFTCLTMAAFSSAARSARTAGVLYLGFFILMGVLASQLARTAGARQLRAISPRYALEYLGQSILHPDLNQIRSSVDVSGMRLPVAIGSLCAYSLFFIWLLRRNLKVVEVVR